MLSCVITWCNNSNDITLAIIKYRLNQRPRLGVFSEQACNYQRPWKDSLSCTCSPAESMPMPSVGGRAVARLLATLFYLRLPFSLNHCHILSIRRCLGDSRSQCSHLVDWATTVCGLVAFYVPQVDLLTASTF